MDNDFKKLYLNKDYLILQAFMFNRKGVDIAKDHNVDKQVIYYRIKKINLTEEDFERAKRLFLIIKCRNCLEVINIYNDYKYFNCPKCGKILIYLSTINYINCKLLYKNEYFHKFKTGGVL